MKKLLLIMLAVTVMACKKTESVQAPAVKEVKITELSQGYILSAEFKILDIRQTYKESVFTLSDEKYKFEAHVINGTRYKINDIITGIQLNAILVKNNYQIPTF